MFLRWPGKLALVFCVAGVVSGCAASHHDPTAAPCPAGQGNRLLSYELFFGRSVSGNREVSDSAWDSFLAQVVTPNLPNGYTVFDATGHWRDPATGRSVDERSKVILAAVPNQPEAAAAIARIKQDYATQFDQSSVGMTVAPACGAF